jgi:hypothetical protein
MPVICPLNVMGGKGNGTICFYGIPCCVDDIFGINKHMCGYCEVVIKNNEEVRICHYTRTRLVKC